MKRKSSLDSKENLLGAEKTPRRAKCALTGKQGDNLQIQKDGCLCKGKQAWERTRLTVQGQLDANLVAIDIYGHMLRK